MVEPAPLPPRLGEILAEVGPRLGIERPAETGIVWARWRSIVGDAVADHAQPSSLRRGVLRVRADSPVWATEIGYLADEIKARVNGAVGTELIREVRTWTAPRGRENTE